MPVALSTRTLDEPSTDPHPHGDAQVVRKDYVHRRGTSSICGARRHPGGTLFLGLNLVKAVDREILRLAVPAFLALVAEPLFLLSDAAIVGHLGTPQLAGLGIAAVILQTVVGLCVFLAYGTTASVARHLGAGDLRAALAQGVDGLWLAVIIGAVATGRRRRRAPGRSWARSAPAPRSPTTPRPTSRSPSSAPPRCWSCSPRPACCADCRTRVRRCWSRSSATASTSCSTSLLVYGLDLGIAGSAIGSVLAQVVSAAWLVAVVVRASREHGAPADARPPRHPRRRARRRRPRHPHAHPARLPARRDVRRHPRRHRRARRHRRHPPGRDHPLDLPGLRPRRHRDRRAGPHRALPRQRRRRDHPPADPADDPVGLGQRAGRRARAGRGLARSSARSSPATRRSQDLLVPVLLVAAIGQPLAGVVFVLDGVLIGAGDGALPRLGRARRAGGVRPRRARGRRRSRTGWSWCGSR